VLFGALLASVGQLTIICSALCILFYDTMTKDSSTTAGNIAISIVILAGLVSLAITSVANLLVLPLVIAYKATADIGMRGVLRRADAAIKATI